MILLLLLYWKEPILPAWVYSDIKKKQLEKHFTAKWQQVRNMHGHKKSIFLREQRFTNLPKTVSTS